MSEDGDIREMAVVLAGGPGAAADLDAGEMAGRMVHRYGPRVFIGEMSAGDGRRLRERFAGAAIVAGARQAPPQNDLDELGKLGLRAFAYRQSPEYAAAKAIRPFDGMPWDHPAADPGGSPGCDDGRREEVSKAGAALRAPTSEQLVSSVAVGVVVVSGPTAALRFGDAEYHQIAAEVQNGLGWLAAASAGGNVSFAYDWQRIPIAAPAQPGAADLEAVWRDPAMARLGFSANWDGVLDYVEALRSRLRTRWAYCAFFVKYPARRYAYASIGGPRIVLQSPYTGWGAHNIDRIFAHETGHIFGAPDEYRESGCTCGGSRGIYGQPNGNCAACAPAGGARCLMQSNDFALCPFTPWHLGFYWPPARPVNGSDATPVAPAAATLGNRLALFWKSNNAANRILATVSADNTAWPPARPVNGADLSPQPPAATVFRGRLYLFWRANNERSRIFHSASADGVAWPTGRGINGGDATPLAVATAVFGDKLYLFWKANDASNRIFASASSDGASWPAGKPINAVDATGQPPAAAVLGNKLYLFWKANDASNRLFFTSSANGTTWPNGKPLNGVDATPQAPAAAVYRNSLHLFWTTNDASRRIYSSSSPTGASWPKGVAVGTASSPLAPAAAVAGDRLYLFWRSNDATGRVLYSALRLPP